MKRNEHKTKAWYNIVLVVISTEHSKMTCYQPFLWFPKFWIKRNYSNTLKRYQHPEVKKIVIIVKTTDEYFSGQRYLTKAKPSSAID